MTWLERRVLDKQPGSWSWRRRERRMHHLLSKFPDFHNYRILDCGGSVEYWQSTLVRPASVTIVNIEAEDVIDHPEQIEIIKADVCTLSPDQFREYDLVFSNSLIEHVGGYHRRRALADLIRAAAPRYWIQTPDRYFPLEPHWVFPMMQALPLAARARISLSWPFGHVRSRTYADALHDCLSTELVSAAEMELLFPEAEIWHERVLGISKSIVAIGGSRRIDQVVT